MDMAPRAFLGKFFVKRASSGIIVERVVEMISVYTTYAIGLFGSLMSYKLKHARA